MTKTITIPEEVRDLAQRADIECSARRDIILFILQNNVNIPEERLIRYEKEYDDKYFAFEQAKSLVEKNYVLPATNGEAVDWSLDYSTCVVSMNLPDE